MYRCVFPLGLLVFLAQGRRVNFSPAAENQATKSSVLLSSSPASAFNAVRATPTLDVQRSRWTSGRRDHAKRDLIMSEEGEKPVFGFQVTSAEATAIGADPSKSVLEQLQEAEGKTATGPAPRIKGVPELYVYDHCPFCVRVRLALGILGIKHRLVFMENDDVETPTSLVGKKIAPIWLDDDGAMAESLDIIAKLDTEKKILPASERTDIKDWQKLARPVMQELQRPRYIFGPPLPEFNKNQSRIAFVSTHQIPPYEKADWKANVTIEAQWHAYAMSLENSFQLIPKINSLLKDLEPMISSEEACTEGGFSYDDIDLWSRLRSLTLVKAITMPARIQAYLKHFEKVGDVSLYDKVAL